MSEVGIGAKLQPAVARGRRRARRAAIWFRRARLDFDEWRRGERDSLQPPRRLGLPSQLPAQGERLATALAEAGRLRPDGAVLDIGCGPGRVAAPLTRYLDASGRYEGFDVMPRSIRWCSRRITRRHPNFRFRHADLGNAQYNPDGADRADRYRFPYPDGCFDAALAGSLFTHLQPFESRHYLSETARVLGPGGRLLGSWFLLNPETEERLDAGGATSRGLLGTASLSPEHELADRRGNRFRAAEPEVPEFQIAAYEDDVRAWHEEVGLRVIEVRYGGWSGRPAAPDDIGQDLLVAELSS